MGDFLATLISPTPPLPEIHASSGWVFPHVLFYSCSPPTAPEAGFTPNLETFLLWPSRMCYLSFFPIFVKVVRAGLWRLTMAPPHRLFLFTPASVVFLLRVNRAWTCHRPSFMIPLSGPCPPALSPHSPLLCGTLRSCYFIE